MPRHGSPVPVHRSLPAWPSLLSGLAALVTYLALLCPVPGGRDGSEFVGVLALGGVAHPPGYPLYTLLGSLFVRAWRLFADDPARAANAWSAVGGAVAIGALHALAARLLATRLPRRESLLVALLPVAALALNPLWTGETTVAEVNSWQLAWVAGAALATLALVRRGEPSARAALLWGGVLGCGLAHHASAVPLALVFAGAVAVTSGRARARTLGLALLAALVPLLSLLHVVIGATHPGPATWPALTSAGVLDHLTAAQYRSFFGRFAPSPIQQGMLQREVWPWLVPGVLAAVAAPWARPDALRPARLALAGVVLLQTALCFTYGVPDPAPYFLPPLALGLVLVADAFVGLRVGRTAGIVLVVAALAWVGMGSVRGLRIAHARDRAYRAVDARLREMWQHLPTGAGFVVFDDDQVWRLRQFQWLEGSRPDLVVVHPAFTSYAAERERFERAYGLDPLAGLDLSLSTEPSEGGLGPSPRTQAFSDQLARASSLPVYLFLPQVPSIRLLDPNPEPR